MDWLTAAERLGVPAAILAVLGLGLMKGGKWLGVNVIKPLVEAHKDFLESIKQSVGGHAECLNELKDASSNQSKCLQELSILTRDIHRRTKREELDQKQNDLVERCGDCGDVPSVAYG